MTLYWMKHPSYVRKHLLVSTKAVIFGTSRRLSQVNRLQGVCIAGADVQFTDYVKLRGLTLD